MLAEKDSPHTERNMADISSMQRNLKNTDQTAQREQEELSRFCWLFSSEFCFL